MYWIRSETLPQIHVEWATDIREGRDLILTTNADRSSNLKVSAGDDYARI
jgi:hypothetical protein